MMCTVRRAAIGLAALLGGSAVGVAVRLALFALGCLTVRLLSVLSLAVVPTSGALDPVYTHALLRSLADIRLQGLAIAGPPGDWLHATWPNLFTESALAHWAPARLVIQPGSPVLARWSAAAIAHAGVLGAGLMLVRAGWRRRSSVMLAGLAMQSQVALGILGAQPSVRELEATGVSFAASAILPWLALRGHALSDAIDPAWYPLMPALLVALALCLAYTPVAVLLCLRRRLGRMAVGTALAVIVASAACAGAMRQDVAAASPGPAGVAEISAAPRLTEAFDRWFDEQSSAMPPPVAGPSRVQIVGTAYHYTYVVNGQPEVIKGMGLNTQYSQQLTPPERAAQLDSDMQALQALGVNTVLGWDPAEFDGVLLDAAQKYGIGVVMPFDLDPEADYADPGVRQQLHDEVLAWVARYRAYPAMRMWGLGNEVLHKIVHPAWVGPQDPQRERNAEAFSDWLVETADAIHAADPDHPVTYRSAEDAFVDWVAAAMQRRGGGPRSWFVWGTNCYQDYLAHIVDHWSESGLQSALWVSEFAPGGLAVPDRPAGFSAMWAAIRHDPDWVLGGAVYAWTRNGPEGVDRNFGLTDDGVPVDGRSLEMLSALFHTE